MIERNETQCEGCGKVVGVGDWPFCPHGPAGHGMLGRFSDYWDEHIAPPPSEFKVVNSPEYHPDRGYHITSLAQRKRLMRLAKMDYRGVRNGMPRREM